MFDALSLFIPFFALVGMGWVAVHIRLLSPEGVRGINTFVLFFGLPAMVFLLAARGALSSHSVGPMLLAYGAGGSALLMVACWLYARAGIERSNSGMLALATVFPNTGFLGLPLLTSLLGTAAAGPIMATLLVDVLWLSSLGLMWASLTTSKDASTGWAQLLRQSFGGALRNPLLWSMLAGLGVSTMQWTLPTAVDKTLNLLGMAASPTALFAMGGVLHARGQYTDASRTLPRTWVLPAGMLLKLIVHPALVWFAGLALQQAGWDLSTPGLITLVMAAALPSASNVLLLAERRGAQSVWVGRLIFWTTAISMCSMMWWYYGLLS
jgi:malonate transporter and related proteins